jgi:hypothetical protein
MESVSYSARELKNYIEIASTGHYPLFDPSWLNQKAEQSEAIKISIRNANQNVKKVFKNISRHHSVDRKKMAIELMDQKDRQIFVQSFLKLVEYNVLENTRTLQ